MAKDSGRGDSNFRAYYYGTYSTMYPMRLGGLNFKHVENFSWLKVAVGVRQVGKSRISTGFQGTTSLEIVQVSSAILVTLICVVFSLNFSGKIVEKSPQVAANRVLRYIARLRASPQTLRSRFWVF